MKDSTLNLSGTRRKGTDAKRYPIATSIEVSREISQNLNANEIQIYPSLAVQQLQKLNPAAPELVER